jgi:SAM-dependent methyltransferase
MDFTPLYYRESRFGGFTDVDGTLAFYIRVNALVGPASTLVDFGCGRAEYQDDPVSVRRGLRDFRGRVARVIGVDVDQCARTNPYLDEFRLLAPGGCWPVGDSVADMIVADWVLEHITCPEHFFREAHRVLAPGGCLCIRTLNRWSYVGMAAILIPNRRHAAVLRVAQPGRREEDVFPTVYRCNTVPALSRMLRKHGLEGIAYGYESEPGYLGFSRFAYALGVLHQKFAPGILKPALFAFARKPATRSEPELVRATASSGIEQAR